MMSAKLSPSTSHGKSAQSSETPVLISTPSPSAGRVPWPVRKLRPVVLMGVAGMPVPAYHSRPDEMSGMPSLL